MRVIFLLLLSSIAFQSNSQTWNNYLQKRFKSYGIWADSILLVPNDTSLNKTGFAIKGSTAYIGDGVKWTAITGGSSVVDSLVYATKANVIKVRDSLLAADNFWSGVNTFLNTLNVSNDLQLGAANASYGNAIFYNANNSNKVQIFSSDTLATDVDIELPTSSGKLALTTDIAPVDTSIISTKAYVNYKDDIQQGFIDMRKLDADSSAWTGYTTRARTQQQFDSAGAAQAVINGVQNDSLLAHNTRTLANQNAINSLDALVVKLGGSQTITGAKTVTNNFKIKDDNGTAISDTKLILENARTATISNTIAVAPYILFSSKTFTSDPSVGYTGSSNNMEWRIRQSLAPAGTVAGQDNRLYFDYKNGNAGSWTSAVSISKDGVQGNITGVDQMTLGNFSGNAGKITFKNIGGGYTAGSIQAAGNVLRVSDGGSGKIEFFNGVVYYGGSATSTGSQLSANGWAFAKNANSTFTASALLHLDKNRSTAGNAAMKFTLDGAALLATPERGALEAMPYRLHFTDSSNQRNTLAYLSDVYKTPMNVADSNYTVVGNEIIIGYTGLTADRACTLPNPASHAGKSLTLFAKGMNDYDLNFSSSYKPKNLNDSTITSVKGDLPKHGVDTGSAIEGFSMKLVSFNNEWVILNYFTHYK